MQLVGLQPEPCTLVQHMDAILYTERLDSTALQESKTYAVVVLVYAKRM